MSRQRLLEQIIPTDIWLSHEALSLVDPDIPDPDPDHGSHRSETEPRILGFARRCRTSRPDWPSVSDKLDANISSECGMFPSSGSWRYILHEESPNTMNFKSEAGTNLAICIHNSFFTLRLFYSSGWSFTHQFSLSIRPQASISLPLPTISAPLSEMFIILYRHQILSKGQT